MSDMVQPWSDDATSPPPRRQCLLTARASELHVVGRLPFGWWNRHQRRVCGDVSLNECLGPCHGVRITAAIDAIGLNQLLLVRRGRIDAVVDCDHRTRRDACATIDTLIRV